MAFRADSVLRFVLQAVWLVLLLCASQTDSNPKPEIAKIQSNKVNPIMIMPIQMMRVIYNDS